MGTTNNSEFLFGVYEQLKSAGINVWLFGGWAQELHALIPPREHKDIDFIYPAKNFSLLEEWIKTQPGIVEVTKKHFSHKRAYEWGGVLVEITLINDSSTKFFDKYLFQWPKDTFGVGLTPQGEVIQIASINAIIKYANHYKDFNYARATADGLIAQ
ncbi:MAG: hypothetical protein AAB561_01465 [Patescibacteria group bacterium]